MNIFQIIGITKKHSRTDVKLVVFFCVLRKLREGLGLKSKFYNAILLDGLLFVKNRRYNIEE